MFPWTARKIEICGHNVRHDFLRIWKSPLPLLESQSSIWTASDLSWKCQLVQPRFGDIKTKKIFWAGVHGELSRCRGGTTWTDKAVFGDYFWKLNDFVLIFLSCFQYVLKCHSGSSESPPYQVPNIDGGPIIGELHEMCSRDEAPKTASIGSDFSGPKCFFGYLEMLFVLVQVKKNSVLCSSMLIPSWTIPKIYCCGKLFGSERHLQHRPKSVRWRANWTSSNGRRALMPRIRRRTWTQESL